MKQEYFKTFQVIWADMDPNRHMRHTAYNDYAAQLRVSFFNDFGLDLKKLGELQIGPILFREETRFLREVSMNDSIKVDILLLGMRKDASRWKIVHNIYRSDEVLSAVITVEGAWMDLVKRKLVIPPEEVIDAVHKMPRHPDFSIQEG